MCPAGPTSARPGIVPVAGAEAAVTLQRGPSKTQLLFRPPGARCGAWHHTPWWHCELTWAFVLELLFTYRNGLCEFEVFMHDSICEHGSECSWEESVACQPGQTVCINFLVAPPCGLSTFLQPVAHPLTGLSCGESLCNGSVEPAQVCCMTRMSASMCGATSCRGLPFYCSGESLAHLLAHIHSQSNISLPT